MASLVEELQQAALSSTTSISDLLRKALIIARRLGVHDFEGWIRHELEGYSDAEAIPPYRMVSGQVQAWNPYHGWIPVAFADPKEARHLSKRPIGQRVAELEQIGATANAKSELQVPFDPATEQRLMQNAGIPLRPTLIVGVAQVRGILEAVRNAILEWTLKLESEGVLGEGMTFSAAEKQTGQAATTNFYTTHIGHMIGSQLMQGSPSGSQTMRLTTAEIGAVREIVQQIRANLGKLPLEQDDVSDIQAELATVDAQLTSSKPKRSVIREGLSTVRNILEGAAANAVASELLPKLIALLGAL